jgi:hypothetical protein
MPPGLFLVLTAHGRRLTHLDRAAGWAVRDKALDGVMQGPHHLSAALAAAVGVRWLRFEQAHRPVPTAGRNLHLACARDLLHRPQQLGFAHRADQQRRNRLHPAFVFGPAVPEGRPLELIIIVIPVQELPGAPADFFGVPEGPLGSFVPHCFQERLQAFFVPVLAVGKAALRGQPPKVLQVLLAVPAYLRVLPRYGVGTPDDTLSLQPGQGAIAAPNGGSSGLGAEVLDASDHSASGLEVPSGHRRQASAVSVS